jgi:hypothetical protein
VSIGLVAPTLWQQQSAGRRFSPSSCWSDSGVDVRSEHNGQELRPCQVVKERGYLVDNLCLSIISLRGNEIKGKVDGAGKAFPELGNVKCANCVGLMAQDDLRLSPSEYGEGQVSARRTGVTSLNIQGTGANLEHRAGAVSVPPSRCSIEFRNRFFWKGWGLQATTPDEICRWPA